MEEKMKEREGRAATNPAFHLFLPQLLNYFCGLFGSFLDSQFSCWVRFWVLGMGMGLGFWDSCSGSIWCHGPLVQRTFHQCFWCEM